LIRVIGYAIDTGRTPHDVGRFIFESYRDIGEFERRLKEDGAGNALAHLRRHLETRLGWCDEIEVRPAEGGFMIESASMLHNQEAVLAWHGVTRLDVETCLETVWHLSGTMLGVEFSYTIGDEKDWAMIRVPGGATPPPPPPFSMDEQELLQHRRLAVASGITLSIGYAKANGAEPEELGRYFFGVWNKAGYYGSLKERWGYGNAYAYTQSIVQSRQVLYLNTAMVEDLDGYTVSSPGWGTEIPQAMALFGVLPDDVYRYFEGGGIPACAVLGLQYQDRSDDRTHRVWVRAR
jgi:hypothetical protein